MFSTTDFKKIKNKNKPLTMVTCYDYTSAQIVNESNIDLILVGDSLAMVMHGHPTTLHATPELMSLHTASVSRGAPNKYVISDMPFLSFRKGPLKALKVVEKLMKAGAHCVKIEGIKGHEKTIECIVDSGVPVMGHLGLTPQFIHQFGGFKVQGKTNAAAELIHSQARQLEELGCCSIVLECVPSDLALEITKTLKIPTIGIGAGPNVDGQVLVFQDLLGMNPQFNPHFLRKYANSHEIILSALNKYHGDVTNGNFPSKEESYI